MFSCETGSFLGYCFCCCDRGETVLLSFDFGFDFGGGFAAGEGLELFGEDLGTGSRAALFLAAVAAADAAEGGVVLGFGIESVATAGAGGGDADG